MVFFYIKGVDIPSDNHITTEGREEIYSVINTETGVTPTPAGVTNSSDLFDDQSRLEKSYERIAEKSKNKEHINVLINAHGRKDGGLYLTRNNHVLAGKINNPVTVATDIRNKLGANRENKRLILDIHACYAGFGIASRKKTSQVSYKDLLAKSFVFVNTGNTIVNPGIMLDSDIERESSSDNVLDKMAAKICSPATTKLVFKDDQGNLIEYKTSSLKPGNWNPPRNVTSEDIKSHIRDEHQRFLEFAEQHRNNPFTEAEIKNLETKILKLDGELTEENIISYAQKALFLELKRGKTKHAKYFRKPLTDVNGVVTNHKFSIIDIILSNARNLEEIEALLSHPDFYIYKMTVTSILPLEIIIDRLLDPKEKTDKEILESMVKKFLDYGSNIKFVDLENLEKKHPDIANRLKKYADLIKNINDNNITDSTIIDQDNINAVGENGDTALHCAVKKGDNDLIKKLLFIEGININIRNKEGKTAKELIRGKASIPIIIQYKIDAIATDISKEILEICEDDNKSVAELERLLRPGFFYRVNLLSDIAIYSSPEKLQLLLDKNINVNSSDFCGNGSVLTVLIFSGLNSDTDAKKKKIRMILEHPSCALNYDIISSFASFEHLCNEKTKNELLAILNSNAKRIKKNEALLLAIQKSDVEEIEFRLEKGANINVQDNEGNTVLSVALARNDFELFEKFLRNGANPLLSNDAGENIYDLIVGKLRGEELNLKFQDFFEKYISSKAISGQEQVLEEDKTDLNSDLTTAYNGDVVDRVKNIRILLGKGANPNAILHLVAEKGDAPMLYELLQTSGIDVNSKKQGKTALDYIIEKLLGLSENHENYQNYLKCLRRLVSYPTISLENLKSARDKFKTRPEIKNIIEIQIEKQNNIIEIQQRNLNLLLSENMKKSDFHEIKTLLKEGAKLSGYIRDDLIKFFRNLEIDMGTLLSSNVWVLLKNNSDGLLDRQLADILFRSGRDDLLKQYLNIEEVDITKQSDKDGRNILDVFIDALIIDFDCDCDENIGELLDIFKIALSRYDRESIFAFQDRFSKKYVKPNTSKKNIETVEIVKEAIKNRLAEIDREIEPTKKTEEQQTVETAEQQIVETAAEQEPSSLIQATETTEAIKLEKEAKGNVN